MKGCTQKYCGRSLLCLILLLAAIESKSYPTDTLDNGAYPDRLKWVGISSGALYAGGIAGFYGLWYQHQEQTRFHFFNDNRQWKQMDKAGHVCGAFQEGRGARDLLRWTGVPDKKANIYGALSGFVLQLPIEVMDGFVKGFGASWGDLLANAGGSGLAAGQYALWNELRISVKYSFHPTSFSKERPSVLGKNLPERAFKDYNGQTYWLTVHPKSFMKEANNFPDWLNVAAGYGAENMLYGSPEDNRAAGRKAYRQYYLAPDINLLAFKGDNKLVNTLLYLFDSIHLPLPALSFSGRHGFKAHPIYF